jgi:hypothetical protein
LSFSESLGEDGGELRTEINFAMSWELAFQIRASDHAAGPIEIFSIHGGCRNPL